MSIEEPRPLHEIISDLRRYLETCGRSQTEVARAAGVNQSTVHRALGSTGIRQRPSKALIKLCNYAEIRINRRLEADPAQNDRLMDAVRLAWDGTEAHAIALARVIRELGRLSGVSQSEGEDRKGGRRGG